MTENAVINGLPKNNFSKKIIWLVIIVTASIFVVLLVLGVLFVRVTYVYDLKTNKPISNAKVDIVHADFFEGCNKDSYYQTNSWGMIFDSSLFNYTCTTVVNKDGYIENGINKKSLPINFVYLQKPISNPVGYGVDLVHLKDGVDILSYLDKEIKTFEGGASIKPVVEKLIDDKKIDFIIESIENTGKEKNVFGYGTAKIKFLGAGGIKQIDGDTDLNISYKEPFSSLNLVTPPKEGYVQEMVVGAFRQYVIRLRDSETYVKIIPYMRDKESVSFMITTFDDSLITPKTQQDNSLVPITNTVTFEPQDGFILNNGDISVRGRGFKPYSQISFYLVETETFWQKEVTADGTFYTSFGDMGIDGHTSIRPTDLQTRTLTIYDDSGNYNNKIIFNINDKLESRVFNFDGLIFNLPKKLSVSSSRLGAMELTDGTYGNRYLISSKNESYNDYLLSHRGQGISDASLPAGVYKLITGDKELFSYSFYDSGQKKSYKFGEYSGSRMNLSINEILSFINNAQIQK